MKAIITDIITSANKVLEQVVAARIGLPAKTTDPILVEGEKKLEELIQHFQAHPAVAEPAPTPAPAASASGLSTAATAVLAFGLLLFGATGCVGRSPSSGHIVRIDAVGTKVGIGQNPATGVYELGIMRVQTELTTIPVFFTNGEYRVAPAVMSYEANAHSAVFGNAAVTSTIATGSNAVNSTLGGQHPPINANTGVSNNLTPISH